MGQRLAAMSAENQTLRQQLLASSAPSSSTLHVSSAMGNNPPPPSSSSSSLPPSIPAPSSSSLMAPEPPTQSPPLPLLPGLPSTTTTINNDAIAVTEHLQLQSAGSTTPPRPGPGPGPVPVSSLASPQSATQSLLPPLPLVLSVPPTDSAAPQASPSVALLSQPHLNPLLPSVSTPMAASTSSTPTFVAATATASVAAMSTDRQDLSSALTPAPGINEASSSSSSSSSSPIDSVAAAAVVATNSFTVPFAAVSSSMPDAVLPPFGSEDFGHITQASPYISQEQQHEHEHPKPPQLTSAASVVHNINITTIADTLSSSSSSLPPSQSSSSSSSSSLSFHHLAVVVDLSQCSPVPPSSSSPATTPFFSLLTTTTQQQTSTSSSGLAPGPGLGLGLGSHLDQSFAHINRASRLLDALRLAANANAQEQGPESDVSISTSKVVVLEASSLRLALSMLADEVLYLQQQLLAVGEAVSRLGPVHGQGLGELSSATNSSKARAIYEERLRCHEER